MNFRKVNLTYTAIIWLKLIYKYINLNIYENIYSESDSDDNDIIVHRSTKNDLNIESDSDNDASTFQKKMIGSVHNITENEMLLRVNFSIQSKITDLQISSNIFESIQFFKLFLSDQFINGIIKETNHVRYS